MKTQPFPAERYRLAPKAELHVHLEGSVGPETLLALARGHGVTPPASTPAGINAWYSFRHFPDFLDRYFFVCRLLRRDADFRRIAHDYLLTAHRQGALHVEFHISASYHVAETRLRWEDILRGTVEGCEDAERECGISSLLIPDLSPHLGREKCVRVLDIILDPPHPRVVALGMGGPSDRWFVEDYASLMHRAKDAGLHVVSHAGEHGPAREIRHALVEFGAERIQHGIAAVNDPEVLQLVADEGIPCDVCPGSNVALKCVADAASHPLPRMVDAGLIVTLGSDDPPMFQTDLLNEYRIAWEDCGLSDDVLGQIARNSLEHCFAPEEKKREWLGKWQEWREQ